MDSGSVGTLGGVGGLDFPAKRVGLRGWITRCVPRENAAADLRACLVLRDKRAAENAAARERCLANAELTQELAADAARRGLPAIDWSDYFRQIGVNYP